MLWTNLQSLFVISWIFCNIINSLQKFNSKHQEKSKIIFFIDFRMHNSAFMPNIIQLVLKGNYFLSEKLFWVEMLYFTVNFIFKYARKLKIEF